MMQQISRKRSLATFQPHEESTRKVSRIMSLLPDRMLKQDDDRISPEEYLNQITRDLGLKIYMQDSLKIEGFFSEYSEEEINGYDADVLNAVRSQDIETLRRFHKSGRPLKCSNSFGESLIHLACRRGFIEVVSFLVHEANVPVQVRDDYGRTILHDAAWTSEPNFQLLKLILKECPDLLYMRDRRGHTPISYARKSHWPAWNKFLRENAHLLIPTMYEAKCKQ